MASRILRTLIFQCIRREGIGRLSKLIQGPGVMFREVDGDYDLDFHQAPRRQFVVNLRGSVDITVASGETRRLESGDVLLAEDTAPDADTRAAPSMGGRARASSSRSTRT